MTTPTHGFKMTRTAKAMRSTITISRRKVQIFIGEGRPCYDAAPYFTGELTEAQLHTLQRRIFKYLQSIKKAGVRLWPS